MGTGENTSQGIGGTLGPEWGEAVRAVIDGGVSAITGKMVDRILPRLTEHVQQLDDPTSVLGNHDLLRAMRNAKLAAIGAVVKETQRKRGGRLDDSTFLDSIAKWADRELSRSMTSEVDPRHSGSPEPLPPARDEIIVRLMRLARGVTQRAKELFKQDGDEPEAVPFFGPCDRVAVAYLECFFAREAYRADATRDEDKDQSDINTLQASATLMAFDEALASLGLDWRNDNLDDSVHTDFVDRFVDPSVGFFAWFQALVREALVNDERFSRIVTTTLLVETNINVREISRNLAKGLDDVRSRLDLVLQEFNELKQVLHDGVMREDAGLVLRDISEMLVRAAQGREELRRLVSVLTAGPKLDAFWQRDLQHRPRDALALRFSLQVTDFIGREEPFEKLNAFLEHERSFFWWQIAGGAGQGKSRLALELVRRALRKGWNAGFLHPFNDDVLRRASDWTPTRKTLMVVDYAAAPDRANRLGNLIDLLEELSLNRDNPSLRLLVLERQPYGRVQNPDGTHITPPTNAAWHEKLFSVEFGERAQRAHASKFNESALQLSYLGTKELIEVARAWAQGAHEITLSEKQEQSVKSYLRLPIGKHREIHEKSTLNKKKINESHRPLFAILASELALQSQHFTKKDIDPFQALLRGVLDIERREVFGDKKTSPTIPQENLSILSNIVGILPIQAIRGIGLQDSNIELSDKTDDLSVAWRLLGCDVSNSEIDRFDWLVARQPDLLADYQVIQCFETACSRESQGRLRSTDNSALSRFRSLVTLAWRLNPVETFAFFDRVTIDFPLHPSVSFAASTIPPEPFTSVWAEAMVVALARFADAGDLDKARAVFKKIQITSEQSNGLDILLQEMRGAFNLVDALVVYRKTSHAEKMYQYIKKKARCYDNTSIYVQQAKAATNLMVAYFSRKDARDTERL